MIASHAVAEKFFLGSGRLDERQKEWLRSRCVADVDCEDVRTARVLFGDRFFEFEAEADQEDCKAALVVIAKNEGDLCSDIVVFDAHGRVAAWLGREPMLGAENILKPRLDEPLFVHETPLDWLRAGRDGVVILNWRVAADRLAGVSLVAARVSFGQTLRARLTRPSPKIFILRHAA